MRLNRLVLQNQELKHQLEQLQETTTDQGSDSAAVVELQEQLKAAHESAEQLTAQLAASQRREQE